MKKFVKIILLSLLVGSLYEAGAQDYTGELVVRSHSMREVGDDLQLTYDVMVSRHCVTPVGAIRLTPKLVAADNVYRFPDVMIQGKKKARTYDRWLRTMSRKNRNDYTAPVTMVRIDEQTDTLLTFIYSIPYDLWMDDAKLAFEQELITYNDDRALVVFALDGGVKLAARTPYEVQPLVSFTEPAPESKQRKVQGQAYLDFQVGKSVILPNFRRNPEELAKIEAAFRNIQENNEIRINGLFIEGYASPDGSYASNDRLSRERAEALKGYILNNFKIPLTADQIRVSNIAEDWEGVKTLLETSNLARRNEVIAIIDSEQNIDRRKQKIQALAGGSVYRAMLTNLYPQLRRVEYQIDFSVKDFGTTEAVELIGKHPELLSQRELYLAAQTFPKESREYENVMLDIIPRQFKDDATAQINAAAIMIQRGELVSAKRILERYADEPAAWNNLGVIELKNGELDTAEALFRKALEHGVTEAQYNIEEVARKRADDIKMERYQNR